jgi:hypothetical protein
VDLASRCLAISTVRNGMPILFAVHKPSTMLMKSACLSIIALTMWLCGFGCAFCCATGLVDSCCINERNTSSDCTQKACCRQATKRNASESREAFSRSEGAIGCSLLPDQARSLAPLPRVTNDLSSGVQALDSPLALLSDTLVGPTIDPPSPLNRGGTYLRLCVLLI